MARILLVSANTAVEPYPVFPLGVAQVAAAAERAGHTVTLWDLLYHGGDEELGEQVAASPPDVIGGSLRNVDNVDALVPHS